MRNAMRCYSCRKYDDCERPWKCDGTMYDCTAYELEQTNEEWMKTLNTEQLAEFIIGERKGCVYADCPNGETPCMSCKDGCDIDKLVEWLKQPHIKE